MVRGFAADTPDDYLAAVPREQGVALTRLRAQIETAAPSAVAGIGYGIIVFRVAGRGLIGISAAQKHCSLHLMSPPAAAALRDSIAEGRWSGVTLQFDPSAPLSDAVVRRIVEFRLAEQAGRTKR